MVFPGFNRLREQLADFINPNRVRNKFNESFLGSVGGAWTTYDPNGLTYIEKGYNYNSTVFAVINQMATKTANVPFYVKEVKDKNAKKKLDQLMRATKGNLNLTQHIKKKQLEAKAYSKNDLAFPMERPNTNQTWTEFLSLYKTFLKCTGNVYIYILAPEEGLNAGKPMQVYLLPSQFVQITVKNGVDMMEDEDPVKGYILTYGRSFIEFEAQNVIHIKYSNPNYDENGAHLYGMSPLQAALRNIHSSNEATDLNIKTLKSGGAFGLIHGKSIPLQEDQALQLKSRLKEMDADPTRLGKIAGISAEVGFTRLSLTSEELKPFDYLNWDTKQICNVLIWSDKLLNNDAGAKYDNVSQYRKQVVTDNIQPDLELLAKALNDDFLPRFKGYENTEIVFDIMELPEMQQDVKELTTWLTQHLDRGVINRDEVRTAINYVPIETEETQKLTVTSDIISLEEALDNDFNVNPGRGEVGSKVGFNRPLAGAKAGFDPNQARDRSGRWTDGGGSWHSIDVDKQTKSHTENGGSTFTMDGKNQAGAKGMASVATFPERSVTLQGELTSDALNDYIELNRDLLEGNSNYEVGTWYDSETGVTWLDIITVTDVEEAKRLGVEHNQIAIFDLENMNEISTGGTGEK